MLVIWLILSIVTGALAARKGYNFVLWALAAGVVGLIILAFQPFANNPALPDRERDRLKKNGNTIGAVLAVLGITIMAIRIAANLAE